MYVHTLCFIHSHVSVVVLDMVLVLFMALVMVIVFVFVFVLVMVLVMVLFMVWVIDRGLGHGLGIVIGHHGLGLGPSPIHGNDPSHGHCQRHGLGSVVFVTAIAKGSIISRTPGSGSQWLRHDSDCYGHDHIISCGENYRSILYTWISVRVKQRV